MVSFTATTDIDASGYKIHAVPASALVNGDFVPTQYYRNTTEAGNLINEGTETSFLYTLAPNEPAGKWYVKVAAFDTFGTDILNYSAPVEVTIESLDIFDKTAPPVPLISSITSALEGDNNNSYASATVTWGMANIPDDFSNYIIRYKKSTSVSWTEDTLGDSTQHVIHGLNTNLSYEFQIRSVDRWSNISDWSAVHTHTTLKDTTPPAVPVITNPPTTSMGTIFVQWTANSESDFDHYEVHVSTASNFSNITYINTTNNSLSYGGLIGTTYYFRVIAVDTSNNPLNRSLYYSNVVSATPGYVKATQIDNFAIDASKTFSYVPVIKEAQSSVWTSGLPATWISWSAHTVIFKSCAYNVAAGNTTKKYVYGDFVGVDGAAITYASSDTLPTSTSTLFVMAKNTDGKLEIVWNSQANMVIGSAYIMDSAITNAKIGSMSADKITTANLNASEYIGINNGQMLLGKLGASSIGILIKDKSNNDVFRVDSAGIATLKNVGVDGAITVGSTASNKIFIDGANSYIRITNATNTNNLLTMGKLTTGYYGFELNKADGSSVFRVDENSGASIQNINVGAGGITCGSVGSSSFKVWEQGGSSPSMAMFLGDYNPDNGLGDNYIYWNGSTLNIKGNITLSSNSKISWSNISNPPSLKNGDWTSYVFCASSSQPSAPSASGVVNGVPNDGVWKTTMPTSTSYSVWMSFATISGDSSKAMIGAWSTPVKVSGVDGAKGQYTTYEYAKTSSSESTSFSWSSTVPTVNSGEFLWTRYGVVIPPATVPSSWSSAVRLTGEKGAKGDSSYYYLTQTEITGTSVASPTIKGLDFILGASNADGTKRYGSIKTYGWDGTTSTSGISIQDGEIPTLQIRGGTISSGLLKEGSSGYEMGNGLFRYFASDGANALNILKIALKLSDPSTVSGYRNILEIGGLDEVTVSPPANGVSYTVQDALKELKKYIGAGSTRPAIVRIGTNSPDGVLGTGINVLTAFVGVDATVTANIGGFSNCAAIRATTNTKDGNAILATANAGTAAIKALAGNYTGAVSMKCVKEGLGVAGITYFTGVHMSFIPDTENPILGDIVNDVSIAFKSGISDTYSIVSSTKEAKCKSVLGVVASGKFEMDRGLEPEYHELGAMEDFDECTATHKFIYINALGEGQINVCKDGGNIQAGDYICSSSRIGKGMKQEDDILRSYTVAKARENCIWEEGEDDIRMIACSYHCG